MPLLVLPYVVIVIANFTMYAKKKTKHTYVSQWYLMAVTVWFPILVISAEACTNFRSRRRCRAGCRQLVVRP